MIIEKADRSDLKSLLDIYNYEVKNGVATLDYDEKSIDEWENWFNSHNKENHPLIVARDGGKTVGYASLSPYREKQAYKTTVELSVYVDCDFRGKGVASALMEEILRFAREDENTHLVVSVITSGNSVSEKLHKKFGFSFCGTIHEVGYKFGKLLSIDNYELTV